MANGAERIRQVKTLEQNNREAVPMVDLDANLDASARRKDPEANAIVLRPDGKYVHKATGIALDNRGIQWADNVEIEAMNNFMVNLISLFDKAQLWLGDAVLRLRNYFDIEIDDIANQYDLSLRRVEEYINVCDAVPYDLRPDHPRISYSHLRLVHWEKYNDDQRRKYLQKAADENLTVSEFAQYLRSLEATPYVTEREQALKVIDYECTEFLDVLWRSISAGQITRKDRLDYAAYLVAEAGHLRNMEIKNARALGKARRDSNSG